MSSPKTLRVSEDKIRDSRIRANLNVFRKKFPTLLSSFSLYNPSEHSRSSLEVFLFHICVLASRAVTQWVRGRIQIASI